MSERPCTKAGVQGYVTNHEFGGMRIPVPVQSLVIRDYLAKRNLPFKLPVGEYFFPNCFVQLQGVLENLSNLDGIAMCSLFMLPKDPVARHKIYNEVIAHEVALHCILESLIIRNSEDVEKAEAIYAFNRVLDLCPKEIPRDLLPELSEIDSFT